MKGLLKESPLQEEEGNKYFKNDIKKINPMKNYVIQFNRKNLDLHRIKRQRGRVWKFEAEESENRYQRIKKDTLKRVMMDLKSQKKVQKVVFEGVETHKLIGALRKLTSLQSLYLSFRREYPFSYSGEIKDTGLWRLKRSFRNLSALKCLNLNLAGCSKITDAGLSHLKNGIRKTKSLRHLSFNFQCCKSITDQGVKILTQGLKTLTCLEHLFLMLKACQKITDKALGYLKHGFKAISSSLKHFALIFYGNYASPISDTGLNNLAEGMQFLNNLQDIHLNLQGNGKITVKGFYCLLKSLLTLGSLQSASLNFSSCMQFLKSRLANGDEGKYLKTFSSLENLSLSFSHCYLIDEDFNCLLKTLQKLTFLKRLYLNLRTRVTNERLETSSEPSAKIISLNECLQKLISLTHLSVKFSKDVTNAGMKLLKQGLQSLTSLKKISLSFWLCDKITSKGLEHLREALETVNSLEYISLEFFLCDAIEPASLALLRENLQKSLPSLSNIDIEASQRER